MTKHVGNILDSVFNQEHHWKLQLLRQWHSLLGNMSSFVQIEKIEQETLVLGVSNSCWLQEFYLLSPLLLKTINEKLANAPIKQLRFKLSGSKHNPKKYDAKQYIKPLKKIVVLNGAEKQALAQIQDTELRSALERFLIRCYQEQ